MNLIYFYLFYFELWNFAACHVQIGLFWLSLNSIRNIEYIPEIAAISFIWIDVAIWIKVKFLVMS
jgi:hypothetical protein